MAMFIKEDGVIKAVDLPAVKDKGVWKKVIKAFVKDDGVWKKFVDAEQFVCELALVEGVLSIDLDDGVSCIVVIGDSVKQFESSIDLVVDRTCKAWVVADAVCDSVVIAGDALERVVMWDGVVRKVALSERVNPSVNLISVPMTLLGGVRDLTECFVDCAKLEGGIALWDVRDVEIFDSMIEGSAIVEDLSGWDVADAESYVAFADRTLMQPEMLPLFV